MRSRPFVVLRANSRKEEFANEAFKDPLRLCEKIMKLNEMPDYSKKLLLEFWKEHKYHYVHVTGNGVSFEIRPDTVGDYLIFAKCACGAEKDLTCYDNW